MAASDGRATRPFFGERQSGIFDPPQDFAAWYAFDLPDDANRDSVTRLMRVWTDDIARMTSGRGTLTDQEPELAALPASLTVTVAWGPKVFEVIDRSEARPSWCAPLPAFPTIDKLRAEFSDGDVLVQIAADSPVTVAHTGRRLVTGAAKLVTPRWVQRGFREPEIDASSTRMRNLLGQLDGTVNPSPATEADAAVVFDDGSTWLPGGTGMVIRRIAMDLDAWDRADRLSRENAIGRSLVTGAPLTGGTETDPPDLLARDELGLPVIDQFAHMRRAMPQAPHERILRRPYNYDDPPEPGMNVNSGLVFVAFAADPVAQFLPIQRRLAEADLLNLWTTPIGSGVYAVLPGCQNGEILGQALLA